MLPATRQRWHSRPYPSWSWYSILQPRKNTRLSWPGWLVKHPGGLPVKRLSPIPALTRFDIEPPVTTSDATTTLNHHMLGHMYCFSNCFLSEHGLMSGIYHWYTVEIISRSVLWDRPKHFISSATLASLHYCTVNVSGKPENVTEFASCLGNDMELKCVEKCCFTCRATLVFSWPLHAICYLL